jgi:hypothetical protein
MQIISIGSMVVGLPIGKGSGVRALKEVVGENKL